VPERTARQPSIADGLDQATERLRRSGAVNPRREATALWAAVAGPGVKPGDVWLRRDEEPERALAERFRQAVKRRASGIPFAYAVGRAGFRTLEVKLDPRALIPRPETEGLVDLVLRAMRETGNGKRETWGVAADIGTGCGCIALSLALEGDCDRVIAVERSPEAAALARENVALVRPPTPVDVREGDLLAPLAGERCRAIVSNPPYLTEEEYRELDPAVRQFEPREALVSGPDGLHATRALLAGAAGLLEPGGLLAVEIDERRAELVRALARAHGWARVAVHDDVFGRPRFLLAFAPEDA
jgi:release factor glutamine methyltransferase